MTQESRQFPHPPLPNSNAEIELIREVRKTETEYPIYVTVRQDSLNTNQTKETLSQLAMFAAVLALTLAGLSTAFAAFSLHQLDRVIERLEVSS